MRFRKKKKAQFTQLLYNGIYSGGRRSGKNALIEAEKNRPGMIQVPCHEGCWISNPNHSHYNYNGKRYLFL